VPVTRETFGTRFGTLMTLIGVALGVGNVWRFPYMVGKFGGAAFVLVYVLISVGIGVPGLMAEWALGRHTRRGTVGAFEIGGLPGGRWWGWFLFAIVCAATAYYTNVVGWVLFYTLGEMAAAIHVPWQSAAVLPPAAVANPQAVLLQMACTGAVILTCAVVLARGLKHGIERVSRWIIPLLCVILLVLIVRAVTLPNAGAGVRWYLLKFQLQDITPTVIVSAMGHAIFSLSLGGTFMVTYGSYLAANDPLRESAIWTTFGDTFSGLLAGLAIFPAVFAFGLEPGSGPGLVFDTLPRVFAQMPVGWFFGLLFFLGLFGAGYLSDIAAFEVLVAGISDNTRLTRRRAIGIASVVVFLFSIPPMLSMKVFLPWDLTFGSGMQTFGALLAAITAGWCLKRGTMLEELSRGEPKAVPIWLYYWIRFVIPGAILAVGVWWILTDLLHLVSGA
jgi:NSS family neurotransmitter:Na+ symporter